MWSPPDLNDFDRECEILCSDPEEAAAPIFEPPAKVEELLSQKVPICRDVDPFTSAALPTGLFISGDPALIEQPAREMEGPDLIYRGAIPILRHEKYFQAAPVPETDRPYWELERKLREKVVVPPPPIVRPLLIKLQTPEEELPRPVKEQAKVPFVMPELPKKFKSTKGKKAKFKAAPELWTEREERHCGEARATCTYRGSLVFRKFNN